jgi:hypothetical protein
VLECADVGIWLRVTFASWYHLPFYLTGFVNGKTVYFGHFGVVDREGNPVADYPRFKRLFSDHESTWNADQPWPTDASLRKKHVGKDDDAAGVKIGDGALVEGDGAGAYMDELFLNKRVGHFYVLIDNLFGSTNLADGANMFHIRPEGIAVGDLVVTRTQRNGIGHTLPIMTQVTLPSGKMRVTMASGSMPRRQPRWDSEDLSATYLKLSSAGGEGLGYDGTPYAKLGGGLRRWRTAVASRDRWTNIVPLEDREVYIDDNNVGAIAARPARFAELLSPDTPEGARDAAIAAIADARRGLLERPASCSLRTKREEAFTALYDAMQRLGGASREQVDAQYRLPEDSVFAELDYARSKTCCWNSTTPQMAEIILDYAMWERHEFERSGICALPTVFRAETKNYDTWKKHAASLGRASEWVDWSEDEPCVQKDVPEDVVTGRGRLEVCR